MKKRATTILAALCAVVTVGAVGFGGYSIVQSSGAPQHVAAATLPAKAEGVIVGGVGSISIPGFDHMSFKAGQTAQSVRLYNPETNDCAFVVSIILPSGKEIYHSEELAPGDSVETIEISDPLEAAIYEAAVLRYSCFTLGDDPQELNGADSTFTLEVMP